MASHVYDTPSDDESADNASPIDLDSRDTAGSTKRRLAPSGNSQREAKSRRTGEPGNASGPGQGQGPNGPRSNNGDQLGKGQSYGSLGMMMSGQGSGLMEDPYQRHGPKREELVDQKLMDELKQELGDPLYDRPTASQSAAAARSPAPNN